jgi:hypothetical protein
MFCLARQHPVRKAAMRLVSHRWFHRLVLACIAANCATLAMGSSRPGFERTALARALQPFEYLFLGIFSAEMLAKWVAMGVAGAPGSYFRSGGFLGGRGAVSVGLLDAVSCCMPRWWCCLVSWPSFA